MEFRKVVMISLYVRQQKRQMYRTIFWTLWERAKVGWFRRVALKHVYYHMWNEWPVQFRCMIQDARGWCTGMTQRDGMGREVRGGFRIGNTCTPVPDSCQCMAKPIQYCKVIIKNKMAYFGYLSLSVALNLWILRADCIYGTTAVRDMVKDMSQTD